MVGDWKGSKSKVHEGNFEPTQNPPKLTHTHTNKQPRTLITTLTPPPNAHPPPEGLH